MLIRFCAWAAPRLLAGAVFALAVGAATLLAAEPAPKRDLDRLVDAYPDFLDRIEGGELVLRDGTRMQLDDGRGEKDFEAWLDGPDIEDQFRIPYPPGRSGTPPPLNSDPGRARNAAFFEKMYGKCGAAKKPAHLTTIRWLPAHGGQRLEVTRVNGVAEKLEAVSRDLERLPSSFLKFLKPSAGTYNCRPIAGTKRVSAHGHGIAIDINVEHSDYWRWNKPGPGGAYRYKNRIPWEIVEIFEKHGFIWGGKWHHYDTMHFEYRPELLSSRG